MKLYKFLEATLDSLKQGGISGETQKALDKRYSEGDSKIALGQAKYFTKKNFLELVFFANSSYGATDYIAAAKLPTAPNGCYTLVLRFYNVAKDLGINKNIAYSQLERSLKNCIHTCDIKFYSDDDSFYYQGAWEAADKAKLAIYKFPGPAGDGKWNALHQSSGGLSNPPVHLTKHLAQLVDEIDDYIPEIAKNLQWN